MKLTVQGLKDEYAWQQAGIDIPAYDVAAVAAATKKNPAWVHFGAGNIFRIFIGQVADRLIAEGSMDTGIVCVESFDTDIIDQIYKPFDNLVLGVTLNTDGTTKKQVIGSLAEALTVTADRKRLVEIFINPGLQMVSFTITEKGYGIKDARGEYFPWVEEELKETPDMAASAMGAVCSLLYKRYLANAAPIAVVSMDNCSHNGEKLQAAIMAMASEWVARGYMEADFLQYLQDDKKAAFPWSMIDKITPRPAESVAAELERLGIEGMKPIITARRTFISPYVNAEGPEYLVIEDKFPNGRPKLEKAGVYLTDRDTVNQVERMKVTTCLNPLHTALAVYGCLLGYTLIADEMNDQELRQLVLAIGPGEGMEVVTDPGILSPEEFVKEVIEVRLPNPFMPDTPQRIATDTSQKVGIRYGETIKAYVSKFGDAKRLTAIPLAIAGWCRYLLGIDDNGNTYTCSDDPMLTELTAMMSDIKAGEPETYTGQLKSLLVNEHIFGFDLYEAGIGNLVEGMFEEMLQGPGAVRAVLKKYLKMI